MEGAEVPEGYVCLVSGDGFEFLLEKKYAVISKLIKHTLESGFAEARTRRIELPVVSGENLEVVCRYFFYCFRYKDVRGPKPEFEIPLEKSVELMMVSNYLNV